MSIGDIDMLPAIEVPSLKMKRRRRYSSRWDTLRNNVRSYSDKYSSDSDAGYRAAQVVDDEEAMPRVFRLGRNK